MGSIDRSRFKSTKVAKLQEQEEKAKESNPGGFDNKYPKRLDIKEGKTVYRLLPAHPDSPEDIASYYQQCTMAFLPYYKKEKNDKGVEKEVLKKRPIFNARVHGGHKKDLVDEYIKLVTRISSEKTTDKDAIAKALAPINGYRAKDGKWVAGIKPQSTWELYALELDEDSDPEDDSSFKFGQLSIKSSLRNKMNEIVEDESASNPMGADPFTDPDDGLPITVKFDKEKQGADMYSVSIPRKQEPFPLSDAILDKLMETPSLEERYVNSYKRKDFEKGYESLEIFDEQNDYGIFDLEEWHEIVEEIAATLPEEEEVEESEGNDKKDSKKDDKAKKEVSKSSAPKKDDKKDKTPSLEKMSRAELKEYIAAKALPIRVLPSMNEAAIVERIKEEEKAGAGLPFTTSDDEEVEEVEEEEEEEKEEKPEPSSRRTSSRRSGLGK